MRRATAPIIALAFVLACTSAERSPSGTSESPTPRTGSEPAAPPSGWFGAACDLPVDYLRRIRRGTYFGRSPEVTMVPRKPHTFASFATTQHTRGPRGGGA
jgi:hypothetical protein